MTSSRNPDPLHPEGLSDPPPRADPTGGPHRRPGRRRIGPIVAGSLVTGFVAAAAFVAAPFVGTRENVVTGAALLGFALGWALLAVMSIWRSDQPQRWAFVPAVFKAVAGVVLVVGSETLVQGVEPRQSAVTAAAAYGVLHVVDGVALKRAVDARVAAPADETSAFAAAQAVAGPSTGSTASPTRW